MMKMTVDEIARATGAKRSDALIYTEHLQRAMDRFEVNTPLRAAAFLATVAIESTNLSKCEEGLYYKDPARLRLIYPRAFASTEAAAKYARNPKALGELLYQGYHGRGLIQLTWRANYIKAGEALGYDYVGQPVLILQPRHAALTAAWYWTTYGCNEASDRGDMTDVTRRVNGPKLMHLAERIAQYKANLEWMLP